MTEEAPIAPPPLEEASRIDPDAMKRWFALPADAAVVLHATRADLDLLFVALRQMTFSQGSALAAFQAYTRGETDQANTVFLQAVEQHQHALWNVSRFTSAMMAKATAHE